MIPFLMTADNIEHAKFKLKGALPQMKASHRAEAWAGAVGYRTFASLLADLKRPTPLRFAVRHIDPVRFSSRLVQLGYNSIDPAILAEVAYSVPLRPWAEYKTGNLEANDRWFRECQRRDIPNIYIETRSKYVRLNWDCISQNSEHDVHRDGDDGASFAMFARFQLLARHAPGKPEFFGSSFFGSIDRLLPETARELAGDFFTMLTMSIKEERRSPPAAATLPRSP